MGEMEDGETSGQSEEHFSIFLTSGLRMLKQSQVEFISHHSVDVTRRAQEEVLKRATM